MCAETNSRQSVLPAGQAGGGGWQEWEAEGRTRRYSTAERPRVRILTTNCACQLTTITDGTNVILTATCMILIDMHWKEPVPYGVAFGRLEIHLPLH